MHRFSAGTVVTLAVFATIGLVLGDDPLFPITDPCWNLRSTHPCATPDAESCGAQFVCPTVGQSCSIFMNLGALTTIKPRQ